MAERHTNPNPDLHIDLLKSQYNIFHKVKERMVREERYAEAGRLRDELKELNDLIVKRIYG